MSASQSSLRIHDINCISDIPAVYATESVDRVVEEMEQSGLVGRRKCPVKRGQGNGPHNLRRPFRKGFSYGDVFELIHAICSVIIV